MRASIIVPTINARPDLLDACLDSIRPTLTADDEILVISGGTFAENCNNGATRATGDFLVFVNDDIKIDQDDWLDRLLEPFAHSEPCGAVQDVFPVECFCGAEQVGIVGCRLIYPSGRLQHTGVYFTDDEWPAHNRTWDAPSGPVDAVTGACMAVRADLFRSHGGFDPGYRNGGEDIDLCLTIRAAGHTVWYTAECTLIHHESMSGPARWSHVGDNIRRFNEQWSFHIAGP